MNSIRDVLDRSTILSIAMISFLASILTLSIPVAAQTLINLIAFGKLLQPVLTLSVIVLFLMIALGALNIWQIMIIEVIQQKLMVKISLNLTRQFTHLSLETFSLHHGPELVNRFFEVVTIKKSLASILLYGVNLSLQLFFGLLLLILYHPLFIVFDVFILLAIFLIIFIPYRKGLMSAKKECSEKHQIGAWLEELLINRFLFRFFSYYRYASMQTDKHLVSFLKARNVHFKQLMKHQIGFYLLSACASSLLLGLGGYLVINNELSLGQLVAAEIVLGALIYAFKRFGVLLENYYDLIASEDKVDQILNLPIDETQGQNNELFLPMTNLEIKALSTDEIACASLANPLLVYAENPDTCQHFVDKLSGFKNQLNIEICINRNPTNDRQRSGLRHHSLLIRKAEWFAGSIYDNLLLNQKNIPTQKIMDWLQYFNLQTRVLQQPEGLKTLIYDWQTVFTELELVQLMIIRALLCQPQLLVIDRILDRIEKSKVDEILSAILAQKTMLVILVTQKSELNSMTNRLVMP